ncbi:uncharacterized protein LOC132175394 [Corylus avellana]|uniref:uncharacterized protein LOC132175283 n=1 Tax=Corylus avellana TaxID=13451 RepID=UPI001E2177A9|nr:uncharacterized protein LOC132175283 [Corylus avellana]XP_059443319.1 uncharacterized protein LOC132175394 [Corylus avellana]
MCSWVPMLQCSGLARHFSGTTRLNIKRLAAAIPFFVILITLTFISSLRFDPSKLSADNSRRNLTIIVSEKPQTPTKKAEIPALNCSIETNCLTTFNLDGEVDQSSTHVCPDYFRWIHEDLRPWKATGISREMVEKAKRTAHFRLLIVKGKAYVEKYKKSIQTRDMFTIWGILQLLKRYPGRVPDLELMFDCDDKPVIRSTEWNTTSPPPLFRYCGDRWTRDVVFPDWSFWGWAEINIRPWEGLLKELQQGNNRSKWLKREPYAYWKGNPSVAETRRDLLKCNLSDTHDWNARLYIQDWILESQKGYKKSGLASQCKHRYKIYIEGYAWSVSEKYILACDSVTLLVKPKYYDFFTRSLQPLHHYWPVRDNGKCKSIKFAVDWGNSHKQKAQSIGKAASDFIQQELKMEYVYDYMFHMLTEYASLLKFEPKVPEAAVELCYETMACAANGTAKKFMMESLVKEPYLTGPCIMPPPFEPKVGNFYRRNANIIRQVEKWENKYWESANTKSKS